MSPGRDLSLRLRLLTRCYLEERPQREATFRDVFMGADLANKPPSGKAVSARDSNAANGSISAHSYSLFDQERFMSAAARSRRADILPSCINDELLGQFDLSRRASQGSPQTLASPLRPTALVPVRLDRS